MDTSSTGRIVVGIDGTFASSEAAAWAARRADERGCDVLLVSVLDDEWGVTDAHRAAAEHELDAVSERIRRFRPHRGVDTLVVVGNPSVELARIATADDLLVIGTHKTGFVQGRLFGSRALRLAAAASATLAVIPERVARTRGGVVAGIDDTAAGWAAVAFAAREAERAGQELTLVLATGTPVGDEDGTRGAREMALVHEAARVAAEHAPSLRPQVRVVRRAPGGALLDLAARAGLLVVGSSRRHEHGVSALGPVASDVLLNVAAPTVIVHPALAERVLEPR